ncbi:MAG: hypothetical protein GXC94_09080 [Comamonadaceae bacterium]|nr:hypothetical protein [Comamonadaceae bacterium]
MRALASWLDRAGYRAECCTEAEQAVARLEDGQAWALLAVDLDAGADALTLLRSFRCSHELPPLLGMQHGSDAGRMAEALADGVALVLDWAAPAAAVQQALRALQRCDAPGPEASGLPLEGAGMASRMGLAQAIEQQGRRLLQQAVHGRLAGRVHDAVLAATRLEQLARRLGAQGLVSACRQLVVEGGADLLLQQRAARVRRELDGVVCGLGRAALLTARPVHDGELDGLPSRLS